MIFLAAVRHECNIIYGNTLISTCRKFYFYPTCLNLQRDPQIDVNLDAVEDYEILLLNIIKLENLQNQSYVIRVYYYYSLWYGTWYQVPLFVLFQSLDMNRVNACTGSSRAITTTIQKINLNLRNGSSSFVHRVHNEKHNCTELFTSR